MEKDIFYQVKINCSGDKPGRAELLRAVLVKAGVKETEIVQSGFGFEQTLSVYYKERNNAEKLAEKLRILKNVLIELNELKPEDWKTKWKEKYQPVSLTERFTVVPLPLKKKKKYKPEKTVFIDSELAFGIGTHPTTKCMAEFIELKQGKFNDFFDVGTGTGILSVLAAKCGAQKIWAIDIDRKAVETAGSNLAANFCAAEFLGAADFQSFGKKAQFDLVAANIITHYLVKFRDKLISYVRPGKYLAVSGISDPNYDFFRCHFDSSRLRCLKISKERGWNALLYKKI